MRVVVLLLSLIVSTVPAAAGTKAGVTLPDSLSVANKRLVLNGMGLREATWLKVDVYVAGLYLEQPSSNPGTIVGTDEAKAIVLRFKRDVGRGDIVKAWNEGFAGNATVPVARLRPMIDQLNSWMPEFEDGDTLSFVYIPGEGVAVDINGARKGVIDDADFARSLFSIWLGPKPPTASLKRGLLGSHGGGA